MADPQNPYPTRPPGPYSGPNNVPGYGYGMQNQGSRPPVPGTMQWKGGPPVNNGPMPNPVPQGQPLFMPPTTSGVNGFSAPPVSQGPSQPANQFSGPRPPMQGQTFMNGPNTGPRYEQSNQFNQPPRPGLPPAQGQFRAPGPNQQFPGGRPPGPGPQNVNQTSGFGPPPAPGPGGQSARFGPPTGTGIPRMPPPSTVSQGAPASSQGVLPAPSLLQSQPPVPAQSFAQGRPNELPVPFHGQGQYDHQVGMALTPRITPANSGPPSEKSSRGNSPAVMTQNFDALEGQFTGTPGTPGTPEKQPSISQVSQLGMPASPPIQWKQPGGQSGPQTPTQQPGFSPVSTMGTSGNQTGQPRFPGPSANQNSRFPAPPQGVPNQQPGFPPGAMTNQRPGFPPVPASANQQPGFPSGAMTSQRPGFPPPPVSTNQQPGFPSGAMTNQRPGFPPPPVSTNQQPGFPPMSTPSQRPGFPPQPVSTSQRPGFSPQPTSPNQMPGFPPPPISTNQQQGFPPPPISTNQQPGFPPPPISTNQQPGFPPPPPVNQSTPYQPQPGFGQQPFGQSQQPSSNTGPAGQQFSQNNQNQGKSIGQFVNSYPTPNTGVNSMASNFSNMQVVGHLNLLQEKRLIPPDGVETPKPVVPNDYKNINCSPDVFRCTLNAIPQTSGLLNKARLPLGILIHPFKDLSQLPVIQSSVIVRCRSCRTYINPFVYFADSRRWKCNLCYRVNELPDEFSFDPVTKTYGDPQRRPEVRSATIEFIAPSEYMLRPPQPAVYLYLIDVSFNAVETGYLNTFCETLLDVLDKIPGDSRTQIGFIAYDSAIHFFNLAEGLSQPQMLTVSEVDDIFLPSPDDLLVNLNGSKNLVIDLLSQLPSMFEGNMETRSALGAALQAAFKMTSGTGGRVTVMQTTLPTLGPGALQNREDSTVKAAKEVPNIGPATDFYKKLALDCSAQQVAVDLFMFNGQYADMASIECISKYSGGSVYYYPSYHAVRAQHLCEKYEADLRRYLTRKIGFESVMRIRCSKGLSIHTFHGNFFVRSTDLLSLPNINPDAGFGMQMSIEESLTDMTTMCFQAALLYTSSKGERRIRVHTLCLPVTNQLSEVYASADQQAIVSLIAKMAVDRTVSSSMSDAREAIVNAVIDSLKSYGATLQPSQRINSLCINEQLRILPMFCLALLKSTAFRTGVSTNLDDRTFALQQCKTLPTAQLMQMLYPHLYPVHTIMDVGMIKKNNTEIPDLPLLQLSSAHVDRHGAYVLDTGDTIYLYVGSAISEPFCQDILDKPNFSAIEEGSMTDLPEMENEGSERLRCFVTYLFDNRPNGAAFIVVREDGRLRMQFFQHFVEDRTESSMSYYEFLQHIQQQLKS